jgi:hypothetical protein
VYCRCNSFSKKFLFALQLDRLTILLEITLGNKERTGEMHMIKYPYLEKGATIGVTAPSYL